VRLLARAPNTVVDHVDANGVTAMAVAALYHHADILRLLADYGANVNFCGAHPRLACPRFW
jgi:ankyrin repeat protein